MTTIPQLTSPDVSDQIAKALLEKASTPRPLTLPELLRLVKPSITKMLRNGHTYSDVVDLLAFHQVTTTAEVVEAYHTGVKKVKGSKGKGKVESASCEIQIDAHSAEAIALALKEQAEIRKGLTKEELVAQLREPIEKMLAAHYTYSDISAVMADCGVQISPATIKSYYKGKKSKGSTERTGKRTSNASGTTSSNESVTSSKSSDKKAPTLKASSSSHKRNKRLAESDLDEEKDLEKEFNL